MTVTDALNLAEESSDLSGNTTATPWVLLVVDDEPEIHSVTTLALDGFEYAGHGLEILNAYSAAEAKKILGVRDDVAMILLDVVMETDSAGLDLARYIREVMKNKFVRIVLRTGQPGQAPEFSVITSYDINDYKEKTELTRQKLFTCVYTSLSSYRDLMALEKNRLGLLKVIEASADLFECHSVNDFAQGVIEQVSALLYLEQDMIVVCASGIALDKSDGHFEVVATTGCYTALVGQGGYTALPPEVCKRINSAVLAAKNLYGSNYYVGVYTTADDSKHVLYVSGDVKVSVQDFSLLELFARNVALAHEKLLLMAKSKTIE
ncbi:MAG: CheY-like chemotaxis protein [Paracoccaceae bacterium]|jgi:CheY-like chemotaxis protein